MDSPTETIDPSVSKETIKISEELRRRQQEVERRSRETFTRCYKALDDTANRVVESLRKKKRA